MKPILKTTLFAVPLVLLITGGYSWYQYSAAQAPEARYRIETLKKGDITQTVSANGTLNPVVLVNVGTQVSGTVSKLFVDFNDTVEKGQALLQLDRSLLAAQARQSAASIGNFAATLELARANEARIKTLFEQEYVSRQELDQAVQVRKSAEAQLAQARASADKDQVSLNYTTIRSPVSGVVIDRLVDLGQTVAASLQTPTLIKIAQDLSEMRIDSSFAEADIGKIKKGQKVRFTVDAFPNRNFTGEVQLIRLNATNVQNVVTYNVRISLENPDRILMPGTTAYVSIGVARSKDVLMVPNAALRFKPTDMESKAAETPAKAPPNRARLSGGGSRGKKRDNSSGTVYVVDGKQLRAVSVQLGITDGRNTEVVSGDLEPEDPVVVGDNPAAINGKPSSVGVRLF